MQKQFLKVFLICGAVVGNSPIFAEANDVPAAGAPPAGIQAFVNTEGKIVFTNLLEQPAPAPAPAPATPTKPVTQGQRSQAAGTAEIHELIRSISDTHGVDPALVSAMMKVESNYNPWARSPKGALGLMQLIPATGARFGVRNFYDPQENIEGGVRYLKFLLQKFEGNVDLSLAAYNAGENLVERLGRVPAIPETRDYVRKIKSIYGKGYAPVTRSALAPAAPGATTPVADAVAPVDNTIFKSMDQRGVIHFSNIGPPN